ncbi:MAG: antirestriction protein ArdA [Oscillospiraceae bacterium]|nr:antirestriction protein ArdA [Oscillospiraceae bacterium]
MMQAVLSNAAHPEYGVATIPFPIPREQFDQCIELVEALEIGNASARDCHVDEIRSAWPVLNRLEDDVVNLDELDYLAKRLDSFDVGEAAQFQAMAEKLDLTDMKDLINLTFCCQETTVITDFSDLGAVGRDHYMNTHGGCASIQELEELDGEETAILLIDGGGGTVTRYGVVYDNGMKLDQSYDGRYFPAYLYEPPMLMVALTSSQEPEDTKNITWLYLPAAKGQIERAMARSGIADPEDMRFRFAESMFPDEVDAALDFRYEGIFELNELAQAVDKLSMDDRKKLGAVVAMAEPEYAMQIRHLEENLDQFEFAPGVHTPAEYGKFMIQESGHFEYDPNLDEFYDYEKYGLQRIEQQSGMFTDRGYISYHGTMNLGELMMEDPAESYQQEQGFQMGGMA